MKCDSICRRADKFKSNVFSDWSGSDQSDEFDVERDDAAVEAAEQSKENEEKKKKVNGLMHAIHAITSLYIYHGRRKNTTVYDDVKKLTMSCYTFQSQTM